MQELNVERCVYYWEISIAPIWQHKHQVVITNSLKEVVCGCCNLPGACFVKCVNILETYMINEQVSHIQHVLKANKLVYDLKWNVISSKQHFRETSCLTALEVSLSCTVETVKFLMFSNCNVCAIKPSAAVWENSIWKGNKEWKDVPVEA